MSGIGHNSGEPDVITAAAQGRLRSFVERIENIEDDIKDLQSDRKDIYAEAKGEGFNVAIIRKVVARRKKDKVKLEEEETLLDLYLDVIGGL